MTENHSENEVASVGVWRLLVGGAAIVAAVTVVTVAATYVAGTESTAQVARDAATYGASESLLTAATATHARLSEAITSTAYLSTDEIDQPRVDSARAAVLEIEDRSTALAAETGTAPLDSVAEFERAALRALSYLERGITPPVDLVADVDEAYAVVVEDVTAVRHEAAILMATARDRAGALTTAARTFVLVVVPVLTLTGVYRSLRNRQQRRDLELRLDAERRYRDEKDHLIASVGHELRTPLTGVLGMSLTLRDDKGSLTAGERRHIVDVVADQSQELAHRVDDLITVTRADSELLSVTSERVDMRAVLAKLTYGWETQSRSRLVVSGRGMVRADQLHVEHVVRNLLLCATRAGGDLTEISIRPGAMALSVEIRDNGGPVDDQAGVVTASASGLGVGMAAASRLTELMGGTLERRRTENHNISILRLPLAPVVAEDEKLSSDLVLDPNRTRPGRRDIENAIAELPPTIDYVPVASLRPADFGEVAGYQAVPEFGFGTTRTWFREAHDLGLGVELELAVIRQAIDGFRPRGEKPFLIVRVTDRALVSPCLDEFLVGIRPARLVLEVLDDGVVGLDAIRRAVIRLGEKRFRFALGEVGRGETTLSFLLALQPSMIKLHDSMLRGSRYAENAQWMVGPMADVTARLGIALVADGVDDDQILQTLSRSGVTLGQGKILSGAALDRPVMESFGESGHSVEDQNGSGP